MPMATDGPHTAWPRRRLLQAGLATSAALGGTFPSPYADPAVIAAHFATRADEVLAGGVLLFGSSVPLAFYAATASARLRQLGVTAPGATIGLVGGVLASGALAASGLLTWTLARWLGFMDVDDFQPNPDDVVVYQLWSWWAIDRTALSPAEIVSFLPAVIGLVTDVNDDNDPTGPTFDESPDSLPIFQLWLPAVAVGHAPPLRPEAPVVGAELAPTFPATSDGACPTATAGNQS